MATKGEAFKIKKDALFDQFASRGVTGSAFRQMYNALHELQSKKRTLKSVAEQFPNIPKKQIQELSKILAQDEQEALDLLDKYQKAQQAVLQEADKMYNIYTRHLPNGDGCLDMAYEDIKERVYSLDDDVRAGLKG
jgi:thioesterase domain-containing protein